MKLGKKKEKNPSQAFTSSKPMINKSKKTGFLAIIILITALLIVWVFSMGRKATESVTVIMTTQSIYKNQQITESMIQPYDMLKGEFEKYSIVQSNGTTARRLLLWDERNKVIGSFAAFPIQANVTPDYRSFYNSRIDNSDSVMYSFPGKEIVSLDVAEGDLQTFKTFLQPGDRVTITGVYTEEETVEVDRGDGFKTSERVVSYRSETLFEDIIVADLLNDAGDSILDIYEDYNGKTVQQQAALDASTAFKDSVEPRSLLVALTPEEKDSYYYYLSKGNIEFKMSLPQRIE